MINGMQEQAMKGLEEIIKKKDDIILENTETIGKLSKGNIDDLTEMKNMFFAKNQDLVSTMIKERKKYMEVIKAY